MILQIFLHFIKYMTVNEDDNDDEDDEENVYWKADAKT